MSNGTRIARKTSVAALLVLIALPLVATAQVRASGVTITPGVTSVGQGARDDTVSIQGTGFEAGAVATISGTGLRFKDQQVFAPTTILASLTVKPGTPVGARGLTVTDPDGSSATCAGCLVIDPAPVVTSIDSLEAGAGDAGYFSQQVEVHGSGFTSGIRVFVDDPPDVVAWPSSELISSTEATIGLVVAPGATPGKFGVTLTNGDGGVARCSACFTLEPGPRLDSVTPDALVRGNTYAVTLSGQYFDPGAVVYVFDLHGGITVSDVVVSADGTVITFDMRISRKAYLGVPGISLGLRNPAPGYGSIRSVQLDVTKSCGTTTC